MTSELLIMTSSAIALAADSVVTVGGEKTYTGVNKLFMLSNNPPMGIMMYNLATFAGIPFETIIKEFRKNIIKNKNLTLDDFKIKFESFLKDIAIDNGEPIENYINNFIKIARQNHDYKIVGFNDFINKYLDKYNLEYLGSCSEKIWADLEINSNLFEDFLDEINRNSEEFLLNFKKAFIGFCFSNYIGVVVAGFEKERLLPSYMEFKINYFYGSIYEIFHFKKKDLNLNEVIVKPFAQSDVINTFLYSINSNTEEEIVKYFKSIQNNYVNTLIQAVKNSDIDGDIESQLLNEILKIKIANESFILDNLMNLLKLNHFYPIAQSISALPKEELSNLAESLIKITSLKRKMQDTLETVGGPVDVAIITKGDGFIWTKRKHYFDGDLNPQFFDMKSGLNSSD